MTAHRHPGRAIELLRKLVATEWFERDVIAEELVMTVAQLESYLEERATMPLARQLCLAQFVIEKVPPLARLGHRLRGQVVAALAFNHHVTVTHADAPPASGR